MCCLFFHITLCDVCSRSGVDSDISNPFVVATIKMAVAIDLTKQPERIEFSGSSNEDISYAKTFWQSIQLQPPMESRLVSSDIKQRLKKAPVGAQSE